jgi:TolA-binding protein
LLDFNLAFWVVDRKTARSFMDTNIEETPALFNAMAWLEKNKKQVVLGVFIIGAVALFMAYSNASKREREEKAGQALSRALLAPLLNRASQADSAEGLLKVATDNSGTQAGQQALLLAGGALYTGGKFVEAQAAFERFSREHSASELAPQALYGVGAALAAQGKLDDAGKSYKEVVDRHPNSQVAPQARYSLAGVLNTQGKLEQAATIYEEVARGDQGSSLGNEAAQRADEIRAKLPAVVAPAPLAETK